MTLTAGDLMTGDILRAHASWPVSRLAQFLTEHAISGAPVVSEASLSALAAETRTALTLFRHGDPAATILAVAREIEPAMIVMGTHGRRGLRRLFVGSVAAQVGPREPDAGRHVRSSGDDDGA